MPYTCTQVKRERKKERVSEKKMGKIKANGEGERSGQREINRVKGAKERL